MFNSYYQKYKNNSNDIKNIFYLYFFLIYIYIYILSFFFRYIDSNKLEYLPNEIGDLLFLKKL